MAEETSQKKSEAVWKTERRSSGSMISIIKERQTEELVFAFCGPLGSGTSTVAEAVSEIIQEYGYSVNKIKVSELIAAHLDKVHSELKSDDLLKDINLNTSLSEMDDSDRIATLQVAGNLLRKTKSHEVLGQLAVKEIVEKRLENQENSGQKGDIKRESRRVATIIDSLKHPDEVTLLQTVYGNMFYLFGVLCPENIRRGRLIDQKHIEAAKAVQLMEKDKSEDELFGQQLLKTIYHSDLFVRNIKDNITSLRPNLKRFVKIILGEAPITPTIEETAMYYAQSAAARSGCLSRQVGAAIIDDKGELISTGCNDVPKYGGGLYRAEDGDDDNRCMNLYEKKCENQALKERIFDDLDKILKEELGDHSRISQISERIRGHERLQSLIEFCRAIHAEIDAITSLARKGSVSLKNTSMYCTTFPCHNCARQIISSGIKAVYYIEPYEKSLAIKLHKDAIAFDPGSMESSETQKKVIFLPFEGVAPRRYLNLFQARDRKINGTKIERDLSTAKPIIAQLLDTYMEYESKIVQNLNSIGFIEK